MSELLTWAVFLVGAVWAILTCWAVSGHVEEVFDAPPPEPSLSPRPA